jgi:Arc/MetJ-type ribon-helix-helix transcriptional regulator
MRYSRNIGSKVPKNLRLVLDKAVQEGVYLNLSEFVRQAVKEKLLKEGFLSAQILGDSQ